MQFYFIGLQFPNHFIGSFPEKGIQFVVNAFQFCHNELQAEARCSHCLAAWPKVFIALVLSLGSAQNLLSTSETHSG